MEKMSLKNWIDKLVTQADQHLDYICLDQKTPLTTVETFLSPAEVSDDTLLRLHHKLRNTVCEERIWEVVLAVLKTPLPPSIAYDFIDRRIAINVLGHTKQINTVQWRMAAFHDEALLTLAIDVYTSPQRDLAELHALFQDFPDHLWMLETLVRQNPSHPQKEHALVALITNHPRAEKLLSIYRIHRSAMLAKDPNLRLETIEELFRSREPHVLKALAANPQTPTHLLAELATIKHMSLARDIRRIAKEQLKARAHDMG
jgi:hypothetical protein